MSGSSKGLEHEHGDNLTNVVEGEGKKELLKGLQSLKHSAVSKAKRASWLLKEHNISPIHSGSSLAEEQHYRKESNNSQPVLTFSSDTGDTSQNHEGEEEGNSKSVEEDVSTLNQSSRSLSRKKKSKEGITKAKKFVNRMLTSGSHTLPSPSSSPTASSPWSSAMELEHYEKDSVDSSSERSLQVPSTQTLYLSPNRSESTPILSKSTHNNSNLEVHEHEEEKTKRETKVKSFAKKILSGSGISKSKTPLATSSQGANERQSSTSLSTSVPNANPLDLKKSTSYHHTAKQQEPFPGIPLKQAVPTVDTSISSVEDHSIRSSGENEIDFNNSPSQLLVDRIEGGGLLEVKILEARDLYAADEGLVDAYCEIKLIGYFGNATKKEVKKTKVVKATLNPRWDETFSFDFDIGVCSGVKIICKDNHRFREDSFLGHLTIDAAGFISGEKVDKWYHLCARKKDKRNCVTGQIRLSLRYTSDSEAQKQGTMRVYGNTVNVVSSAVGSAASRDIPLHNTNPTSGGIGNSNIGGTGAASSAASTKLKAKKKLKKYFGLNEEEVLHDEFSCALRGKQGRLYVTSEHLYFFANILGVITKLKINYADIKSIEKRKTALLFPNAIIIRAKQSQFFFYSFIHRDRAYELIRMKKCTYSRKKKGNLETEEYGGEEPLDQEEVEHEGIVNIDDGDVLDMVGDNDKEFLSINKADDEDDEETIDQEDTSTITNDDAKAITTSAPAVSWYDVVGHAQQDSLPSLDPIGLKRDASVISSEQVTVATERAATIVDNNLLSDDRILPTEDATVEVPPLNRVTRKVPDGVARSDHLSLYASLFVSFLLVTSLIPGLSTSGGWRGYCSFLIILCTLVLLLHSPVYNWLQFFGLNLVHVLTSGGVDRHMEFVGSTVIPILFQPVLYALFLMTSAFLVSDFEIDGVVSLLLFSFVGSCVGLFFNQPQHSEQEAT